jgi:hypothetical protein
MRIRCRCLRHVLSDMKEESYRSNCESWMDDRQKHHPPLPDGRIDVGYITVGTDGLFSDSNRATHTQAPQMTKETSDI